MTDETLDSIEAALDGRDDLNDFSSHKRALFALQIEFGIEDLVAVASDAIVDGENDKSVDLVYIDDSTGRAVICQDYSADTEKTEAPSSKAADLAQGVQWLIGVPLEQVPDRLASVARLIRDGLADGSIGAIDIWYIHNCPESANVAAEMTAVRATAAAIISTEFPDSSVEVTSREIGKRSLAELYRGTQVVIEVTDHFEIEVDGVFESEGENWSAVCASIPGSWLVEQFKKYDEALFSANVRGYLGSKRSDRNINNGIKETAREDPGDFWVFNNGVTALVNDFSPPPKEASGAPVLTIDGLAIVNGAQTTGSLASSEAELSDVRIMARFVKCGAPDIIRRIIRFNNRQNKVEAVDFRSNDAVQNRLRSEFEALGSLSYSGGRRGGIEDVIRRPGDSQLPATTASQALAAFHGDPDLAYNRKSEIWELDHQYGRFFREATTARHLLFVFSLVKAIDARKAELRKISSDARTEAQIRQLDFLSQRGATYLLVAAVASGMESILGKQIANRFSLQFTSDIRTIDGAVAWWAPIVGLSLSLWSSLVGATEQGLKNSKTVETSLATFQGQLEAIKEPSVDTFSAFASKVDL